MLTVIALLKSQLGNAVICQLPRLRLRHGSHRRQCWFAENLQAEYENGDGIPTGLSDSGGKTRHRGRSGLRQNALNLETYGIYNWYAVDDARGLCPSIWHVPTDEVDDDGNGQGMSEAEATTLVGGRIKASR